MKKAPVETEALAPTIISPSASSPASSSGITSWPSCGLCGGQHDAIVNWMMADEPKHIPDDELRAELLYVEREHHDATPQRQGALAHRLAVLRAEEARRRRIAATGGPLYKGRAHIDPDKLRKIKAQISISDLIGRDLDIRWMGRGKTYFACPAHGDGQDRCPSLVAYEDQGSWFCFGCNTGGDVLDWMIVRNGLSFRQAVEEASKWAA